MPVDGGQFATGFTNFVAWKRYRGGEANYLWIVNLADLATTKIPRTDSNDINPMWIGNKVYFLSDRDGPMTLFEYDPQSKNVKKLIPNAGMGTIHDIVSASAGPGGIVYEQFGEIHVYDIASAKEHVVPIRIAAALSGPPAGFQNVASQMTNPGISLPVSGQCLKHTAKSSLCPRTKAIRNLTHSPGVMDRSPVWSPDGLSIAYSTNRASTPAYPVNWMAVKRRRPARRQIRPTFLIRSGRRTASALRSMTTNSTSGNWRWRQASC